MTDTIARLSTALAGRYTMERELGQGGMATVYLAEDLKHKRKVALKVLRPELAAVLGAERFVQEITTTAALQHPHILPLFDSGTADGFLFYVMPYIEGETLRAKLDRETQLGVDEAVRIAREVADALDYAHRHGVIHRDIKPENILLHDGRPVVADFGIALALSAAAGGRLTETGLSLGTPHYMSPEQATGTKEISARSDVYSLGSVLYEMLAGEPPHTGGSAQQIVMKIIAAPVQPVEEIRKSVPHNVAAAVAKSLEKLPADRFASAAKFAEALGNAAYTDASGASGGAFATAGRRGVSLRVFAITSATLAAVAIVTTTWGWRSIARGNASAGGEPRFWSIALPDSAPAIGGHGKWGERERSFDLSADGRLLVFTSPNDNSTRLWQLRTDLGTASPIAGTAGAFLPTLSPDGRELAFVVNNQVHRMAFVDGVVSRVAAWPEIHGLWWPSPDRIFLGGHRVCMRATSPNGGQHTQLPKDRCVQSNGLARLRKGSGLLVVSVGGVIAVVDGETGHEQRVRDVGATDTTDAAALVAGDTPLMIGERMLLFVRDSTLFAAPIDLSTARLTAEPRAILPGVRHEAVTGATQLALSADGTLAWAPGGDAGVSRFVWVDRDGRVRDTLPIPPSKVNSYALSDDGRRLAYSVSLPGNESVIRVVDLARDVVDSARFAMDLFVRNWVSGGTALAVRIVPRYGSRSSAVVRPTGSAMTLDTSEVEFQAASADGRMRCTGGRMWPGTAPRDSIRYDKLDRWCRFSPDGHRIAWDTEDGLFVAPVDMTAERARRKVAPSGANEARWSRDGRELYYRDGNKWFGVPAPTAPGGTLTPPRLIFRGEFNQALASWDMGPDGRFLLLQGPPSMRATHLNVITNFPRYVQAKLRGTTLK